MNCVKINFSVEKLPSSASAVKEGNTTLAMKAEEGKLTCSILYSYRNDPLNLEADIHEGAKVEIVLIPYRIELYVDGVLQDEEWPKGELCFACGDEIKGDIAVKAENCDFTEPVLPNVIGEFTGAEGWKPEGNVFVGDCMPYLRDGEYHLLYLKDRHHHRSKWGLGAHQWEHLSTKDFKNWAIHPMAVPITDPDEGSICTGSWIRHNGKEYLFYTVRKGDGRPAPIQRSVSNDGYHFEKDADFGFTLPERYNTASARDPKVIQTNDGLFHMFLTTTLEAEGKGCLAHYVSEDLDHWTDYGEPIYVSDNYEEPECPDYFVFKDKYYLVFSLCGAAHYMYSDEPLTGWKNPKDPIIPCESVPKGAMWGDKVIFSGFRRIDGYAGVMTFREARADENGELIFD